jgi:hypothetical protein
MDADAAHSEIEAKLNIEVVKVEIVSAEVTGSIFVDRGRGKTSNQRRLFKANACCRTTQRLGRLAYSSRFSAAPCIFLFAAPSRQDTRRALGLAIF